MSDLELQTLLGFNEEDLVANRDCRLSARQQEQIHRSERLRKRLLVGTGIVLVLIAAGNDYVVISSAAKQGFLFFVSSQNQIASLVIRFGIPMLLFGFLAWDAFTFSAHRMDHSVQVVRGRVHFIKMEKVFSEKRPNGSIFYRTLEVYGLCVGKINFEDVNQRVMDVIEAGDIYAFYYVKDTKNILSAECIAKGK
jgi:hypothetical protein